MQYMLNCFKMKKIIYSLLVFLVIPFIVKAQISFPVFQWTERVGGSNVDVIKKVTTDDNGNVYVIGEFKQTIHFNTNDYTSLGGSDVFIAKFNADGTAIWITTIGGTGDDFGEDISFKTFAGSSVLLICGSGTGTLLFSPPYASSFTRAAQGDRDFFIGSLNTSNGNIIAQMSGCTNTGVNSSKEAFGAAFDNTTGQIFVTGYVRCSGTDFFGNNSLPDNGGGKCFFFAKYDSNLSFNKVRFAPKSIGNPGESAGTGIFVAPAGNGIEGMVSVCGYYQSQVEFAEQSPGLATTPLLSNYNPQGFWLLFDPSDPKCFDPKFAPFNLGYSFDGSGPFGYVIPTGILIAPNTNLYVTGYYNNNINIGGINLNSSGANDAFVSRLDFTAPYGSTYTYWLNRIGNTGQDKAQGLALSGNGSNLFVTGGFNGTLSFSGSILNSIGDGDIFIAKYNAADGTGNWITRLGGKYGDQGLSIAVNADNDIYFGGLFEDSVSVNGGFMISSGNTDGFVGKLKDLTPIIVTPAHRMCIGQSFTINYSSTETYLSDNVFIAQLSDELGNFANAVTIGSVSSSVSGSISVNIPSTITPGSGYRVRVVSTDPVNTGNNSAETVSPLIISAQSNSPVCIGDAIQLSLLPPPVSASWLGTTSPFTSTQISPVIPNSSLIYSGHYQVTYIDSLGCHGNSGTEVDIDPGITYYLDYDGDSYGNLNSTRQSCTGVPAGYVANALDCNDNNSLIHPGAAEICNGLDDNCDGAIDDGITGAEYFFDSDPGIDHGIAIANFSMNNPVTINYSVPLSGSGLSPGNHKMYVRIKDMCGLWSLYEGQSFYIIPSIVSAEYFFDRDPGVRNGIPLTGFTNSNSVSINSSIPLTNSGLAPGSHKLFVRLKDTNGLWSLYEGQSFYVLPSIDVVEYFFDTDRGIGGSGTTRFNITNPSDIISQSRNISYSALSVGQHRLYVRLHDNTGKWSLYENQIFTVKNCNPLATISPSGNLALCSGSLLTANPGASYKWLPNGETTQSITVTTAGEYSVEVYDIAGTGCSAIATKTITVFSPPTATISGTTTVCQNSDSPIISFTGANGVLPYTFTYSINGGQNLTATTTSGNSVTLNAATGTPGAFVYTLLSVSDLSGCSQVQNGSATVIIQDMPSPPVISGATNLCAGGDLNLSIPPNSSYASIGWYLSNNSFLGSGMYFSRNNVQANLAGDYYVLITDPLGCTSSTAFSISVHSVPTATISGSTLNCQDLLDPHITLTGADGVEPYTFTYNINGGQNLTATTTSGNSVTLNAATGTPGAFVYTLLSVSDLSGCSQLQNGSATVIIQDMPAPPVISGATNLCAGGDLNLSIPPNSSYASIGWYLSNHSFLGSGIYFSRNNVQANLAGDYYVLITDPLGCTSSTAFSISVHSVPAATISGSTLNCQDLLDPHITLTGADGVEPYTFTYNINGGQNLTATTTSGNSITVNAATGTPGAFVYTLLSVSDLSGCSQVQNGSATVIIQDMPSPPVVSGATNLCAGGDINLSIPPNSSYASIGWYLSNHSFLGSGMYFSRNNVQTNLAGDYYVLITDPLGCTSSTAFSISVHSVPAATISGSTLNCQDLLDPHITITGADGVEPYTFTYNINGGQNLTATTTSGNSITVNAASGTPGAFVYTLLSVSDLSGCSQVQNGSATVIIQDMPSPPVISGATNLCAGGDINLSIPPNSSYASIGWYLSNHSFLGSGMYFSRNNVQANLAGDYYVLITDPLGCTSSTAFSISVHSVPTATISGSTLNCQDLLDPHITLTGADGVEPYTFTYNINGGQNLTATTTSGNSITLNAASGTPGAFVYTLLSVSDLSGCSQVQNGSATVIIQDMPTPPVISGATNLCAGGDINLSIPPNSSYASIGWYLSNNSFLGSGMYFSRNNVQANLAGDYYVLITDPLGCTSSTAFSISVHSVPTATISGSTLNCQDLLDPHITLTGADGVEPYTFTYNINGGQNLTATTTSGNSITLNAASGTPGAFVYTLLSVSDLSGCSQVQNGSATVIIQDMPAPPIISGATNLCAGGDLNLSIPPNSSYASIGWYLSDHSFLGSGMYFSRNNVQANLAGDYYVLITDPFGCTSSTAFSISVHSVPAATISGSTSVCQYSIMPDISFTGVSGEAPYTFSYNINGGQNLIAITSSGSSLTVASPTLTSGIFVYNLVSVSDNTGCVQSLSLSATISINSPSLWYKDADDDFYSDGITTSGCTQPAGYYPASSLLATSGDCDDANPAIHPGAMEVCGNNIDDNCDGQQDETCCTLTLALSTIGNACPGTSSGSVAISVSAGAQPISFLWNNGSTAQNLAEVSSGFYSVTATDANGCTQTLTVQVSEYPEPYVSFTGLPASMCQNASPITLTGIPSGGIFDGIGVVNNTFNPTGLSGQHSVLYFYTDANGCSNVDMQFTSIVRTYPDPVDIITTDNNFCEGNMITLTAITLDGIPNVNQPELIWYEGGCGSGASIGNGTSITLTPTGGVHNYYVRSEGVCNITNCVTETITVGTAVQEPTSISCSAGTSFCAGTEITLTEIGGSLGDGGVWIWSEGNCSTGTPLNSSSGSVVLTPSTGTHTYFVKGQGLCNTTSCVSITLTVIPPNVAAGQISTAASPVCQNISFDLSVNLSSSGFLNAGSQWTWYEGGCGNGAAIGTGTQILVTSTLTGSQIYSVRAEGQCNTSACTRVLIKIYPESQAPTSVVSSNNLVCYGTTSSLSLIGGSLSPGAQWTWYDGSCGNSNPIGTGSSLTINPGRVGTNTYFVRAEGGCGNTLCKSIDVFEDNYVYFNKLFGTNKSEEISHIIPTSDGAYVFCGSHNMSGTDPQISDWNYWISKINENGSLIWDKKYGGTSIERTYFVVETSDGGYLVTGSTNSNNGDVSSNHGGFDAWVMKLNSDGNIIWKKCYGGSNNDELFHITVIKSGNTDASYILTGGSKSNNGDLTSNKGNEDVWVLAINTIGDVLWSKTYGGDTEDVAFKSCLKSNGELKIVGRTASNNFDVSGNHSNNSDMWVIDLSNTGDLISQHCYGGTGSDEGYTILNYGNDEFYILGMTNSSNGDISGLSSGNNNSEYWLMKINASGLIIFSRTYGSLSSEKPYIIAGFLDWATQINLFDMDISNRKIYLTGDVEGNGEDVTGYRGKMGIYKRDLWLAQLDLNGNLIHQQVFGGIHDDFGTSIKGTSDGGVIVAGWTNSNNSGDVGANFSSLSGYGKDDGWIIKIGPSGYKYEDHDHDTYGNPINYLPACQAPIDWVFDNTDCNDNDPNIGGIPMLNGEITGPASMCTGIQTLSYSVTDVPNTSTYNWTLPAGMSIRGAAHNNVITLRTNASFHGGEIAVEAYNTCNNRLYRSFNIVATEVPVQPGTISGNGNVCPGTIENYSVTSVSGLTYQWTVPRNATIVSANGSPTVSIQFNSAFTGGRVGVVAINNCGSSTETSLQIRRVSLPPVPDPISGTWSICVNTTQTFSVSPLANVTSYMWTAPVNSTIISGQGTTQVSVQFADNFSSGDLTVYATNCAGNSSSAIKRLRKTTPPSPTIKPELIINNLGPRPYEVCILSPYTYDIHPIQYATDYTWIMPANAVILGGQGTTEVRIQYLSGFVDGEIKVVASNCNGNSDTARWTFRTSTSLPARITGPLNEACAGSIKSFSAVNGRGCNWVVTGANLISGQGTPTIQVSFPLNFTQGTISVQNVEGCGATPFISNTVYPIPPVVGLIGSSSTYGLCGGGNNIPFSIVPVESAISYTWAMPTGITLVRGQGSANIVTNIASTFTARDLCVYATNVCGNGIQKCFRINTVPSKPIFDLSGNQPLCPGTTNQYSVRNVASAISYTWTVPAGWIIRSGQGTRFITILAGNAGGDLQVVANNGCGSSEPAQRALSVLLSCKTAVQEVLSADQNFDLNIFPNPAGNEASVIFRTSIATNYRLEIIDMTGRVLLIKNAESNEGDNTVHVLLSSLSNGLYLVRLITELDKPREIKFVKQ